MCCLMMIPGLHDTVHNDGETDSQRHSRHVYYSARINAEQIIIVYLYASVKYSY